MKSVWNKRSHEDIIKIVENLKYTLLNEYYSDDSKKHRRVIIQDEVGYKYDIDINNLIKGHFHSIVNPKRSKISLENISLWLKINNKPFELYEWNKYRGNLEKLWFRCLIPTCNKKFTQRWGDVCFKDYGCPNCSVKISDSNRLSILYPEVSKEWDYDKNDDTPNDVSYGSSQKRWWTCFRGHSSYLASISNKTKGGTGCPKCSDEQKESRIASELKTWFLNNFENVDIEHKMFRNPKTNYWLKCDIYLGEKESIDGVYIEIHGEQHYRLSGWNYKNAKQNGTTPEEEFEYNKKLDKLKKKFACKHGTYIEIDLRKIKTVEQAIEHIENTLKSFKIY